MTPAVKTVVRGVRSDSSANFEEALWRSQRHLTDPFVDRVRPAKQEFNLN